MRSEWTPTEDHFSYNPQRTSLERQRFAIRHRKIFSHYLQQYDRWVGDVGLNAEHKRAEFGSAIGKAILAMSSLSENAHEFNIGQYRQELKNVLGDDRLVEGLLSGAMGEIAVAQAANEIIGLHTYIATSEEDRFRQVDLWFDPTDAELSDYVRQDTLHLPEDQQLYNMVGVSIKAFEDVPANNFAYFYECSDLPAFNSRWQMQKASFFDYYRQLDISPITIDQKWQNVTRKAKDAAYALHGFRPKGDQYQKVYPGLNEHYSNVVPCIAAVPNYRSSYGLYRDGFPSNKLTTDIYQGILNPRGES